MAVTGDVVGEEIINVSANLLSEIGKIGSWLQALGIVIIIGIIFEIIMIWLNLRRMKEVAKIKYDMIRIEKKIDKILKK